MRRKYLDKGAFISYAGYELQEYSLVKEVLHKEIPFIDLDGIVYRPFPSVIIVTEVGTGRTKTFKDEDFTVCFSKAYDFFNHFVKNELEKDIRVLNIVFDAIRQTDNPKQG